MHPHMFDWWRFARRPSRAWGAGMGCGPDGCSPAGGPEAAWESRFASHGQHDGDFGGGAFGVRRPLRFLAHKLDLDDRQVGELARILSDLKTERAQADVDHRRSTAAFADRIADATFDETKVAEVAGARVRTAEHLRDALVKALGKIHALLNADQREKLAYLIRTGVLAL
ncbi:MAG TPA: Spy/CpxP family protein refolding chaperone [Polyangiaceae bacterium]|nr:Spy/CpxP family protein refolding chaperone [Polyangiaceae bacterium]